MPDQLNEIKVLLAEIAGEIDVSEEKLKSKLDTTHYLQGIAALKTELYNAISTVDNKVNALYIKVALLSGGIMAIGKLIERLA